MNHIKSIFNAQRFFLRSCLESAPQAAQLRSFNPWTAGQRRGPARLPQLKQSLLHTALEQTAVPRVQRLLCGAANVAAETAWNTACPLLLFPCLFEEMAADILNRHALEEPMDDSAAALALESDHAFARADTENTRSRPISTAETRPAALEWEHTAGACLSI